MSEVGEGEGVAVFGGFGCEKFLQGDAQAVIADIVKVFDRGAFFSAFKLGNICGGNAGKICKGVLF